MAFVTEYLVQLIAKQVNATDRRLVRLSLTRKGRRLYEQIGPLALDYERRFLSTLTPAEAATFRGLMERLLAQTEPLPPIDEEIDA